MKELKSAILYSNEYVWISGQLIEITSENAGISSFESLVEEQEFTANHKEIVSDIK